MNMNAKIDRALALCMKMVEGPYARKYSSYGYISLLKQALWKTQGAISEIQKALADAADENDKGNRKQAIEDLHIAISKLNDAGLE